MKLYAARSVRSLIFLLAFLFTLVGGIDPAAGTQAGGALPSQASGLPTSALPAFSLNGRVLNLATRPGWRVIYFWSATCPCVRACERYTFVPLARKYRGLVSFYAVAADRFDLDMPRAQIRSSIAAHHLPFPVLLDPHHKVAQSLGAVVTPQAFLLDPQGRVVFAGIPDDSRRYLDRTGKSGVTQSYLGQALCEALAGKPLTQPQIKDEGCMIAW